jgi:DNA primase
VNRTRIDVVLAAIGLEVQRVRGTRAWVLCPFHESSSTSAFFVRRAGERAGTYHCFSCKAGGSLADLVMHVRGLAGEAGEKEARDFIRSAGKGFEPARRRVRVVAREAEISRARFSLPREIVFAPWEEWLTEPRAYLEGRGLGREEAEAFRIGYAVSGPLAGRVVVPFLDERGYPQSYSARTLVGDVPKYRTPDEREGASVDAVFGAHLWPPAAERKRCAVIATEGAIDAMSIRRILQGMPDARAVVCALNGSEPQAGQLLALATFGVVLDASDDDPAGNGAARTIRYAMGRHAEYRRLLLPADANTMLAGGDGARPRPKLLRKLIGVALTG